MYVQVHVQQAVHVHVQVEQLARQTRCLARIFLIHVRDKSHGRMAYGYQQETTNNKRLYSKQTGDAMDEFDPPEIQQTPLEHVILQLKSALSCQVLPVLQNVISPPGP